eukprot:TRINITY_DN6751_c0_g1_i1.p1 TRINITY_DN6751_c0_g1~~TRINITY_DN6751_c0_g1_i1.p1  ORF type:complete len:205 (-),score=68.53 TRINITY_DN6751_c0_g1_i1:169-783(-)
MKVLGIFVYNCRRSLRNPELIFKKFNKLASSFDPYAIASVERALEISSKEIASRIPTGERATVKSQGEENKLVAHCYHPINQVVFVVMTDGRYPARIAHNLGHKTVQLLESQHDSVMLYNKEREETQREFTLKGLEEILEVDYEQNPKDFNTLMTNIDEDVEDSKEIEMYDVEGLFQGEEGETVGFVLNLFSMKLDHKWKLQTI